jgi:hypothetical protein
MVHIYPDRSVHALPALEYYFYDADGKEKFRFNSDDEGNFEGELLFGTYRVIAANTAAATDGNVVFAMNSYESATVSINNGQWTNDNAGSPAPQATTVQPNSQLSIVNSQLNTRSQLSIVNCQLSIYSVVVPELTVMLNIPPYRPAPMLLTKRLELIFTLSDGLDAEVESIAGVLPGIYSSVYLATGLPTPEAVSQSPATAVRFDAVGKGDERRAQISLPGLGHPEYGAVYTNSLELTLAMNDGSGEALTVDLTKDLSDILSQNQGVLPQNTSVIIRLERASVSGTGGGITGSLLEWKVGGVEMITVN